MKFKYQKLPFRGHDSRNPLIARPYLPIYLLGEKKETESPYYALLDSGADRVIFPSDLAIEVGIAKVESGDLERTVGIGNQALDVYYHDLKIKVLGDDKKLNTKVGFASGMTIPLLGRSFFAHFKTITFNENKEEVELK
jgi:hypothetical protein